MSCKCEMWAPRVWLQLRHGSVKLARGWERSTLLGVGGGLGFFHPLHLQDSSAWKKTKVTNLQYRLQNSQSFSQINLFFKMWSTSIASEFTHTNPASLPLTQDMWVTEKKSHSRPFVLLFACTCTWLPKNMVCFVAHDQLWMKWDLIADVKTCTVILKNHSATVMYYLPAVSSCMMKGNTSKQYY